MKRQFFGAVCLFLHSPSPPSSSTRADAATAAVADRANVALDAPVDASCPHGDGAAALAGRPPPPPRAAPRPPEDAAALARDGAVDDDDYDYVDDVLGEDYDYDDDARRRRDEDSDAGDDYDHGAAPPPAAADDYDYHDALWTESTRQGCHELPVGAGRPLYAEED